MEKICVWADGTWCFLSEVEEYTFMSDDYRVLEVPDDVDDIDDWLIMNQPVELLVALTVEGQMVLVRG